MSPVGTAPAMHNSSPESVDTEITLGTGKMLAIFFGLVVLCATFFGMGYSMGRNATKSTAELLPSPSTSRNGRALTPARSPITTTAPQPDADFKPADAQGSSSTNNTGSAAPSIGSAPSDQAAGQPSAGAQSAPSSGYFVQVAAVSKQEDAEALVESLKARQYQAFIADPGTDKLFHVQVGPFADVKEAENMRTRLANDGYNPILKK